MLKTPDWAAGAEYLREHASELIPLIDRFPVCELKPEPQDVSDRYCFTAAAAGCKFAVIKKFRQVFGKSAAAAGSTGCLDGGFM